MLDKIASIIMFLVGIVNIIPVIAFFDISKTTKLYGLPIEGENLTILMRHRGVLLAIVGIALVVSVFKTEYRILAIGLALLSKIAFVFLTFTSSDYNSEIKQVALIDIGAIILLLIVLGMNFGKNR